MIVLNGSYAFETEGQADIARLSRNKTFQDSIGGYLIKTRSRYSRWRMSYILVLNQEQLTNLELLFTQNVAPMDFIDHRGFSWLIESGTDDATHAYSTGGEIEDQELVETPLTPIDWAACNQAFRLPLTIIVNARGLTGNTANAPDSGGGGGGTVNMTHDVPTGTVNGINTTFTLADAYTFIILFVNGIENKVGIDYTLSGSTITFLAGSVPQTSDILDCYGVA